MVIMKSLAKKNYVLKYFIRFYRVEQDVFYTPVLTGRLGCGN